MFKFSFFYCFIFITIIGCSSNVKTDDFESPPYEYIESHKLIAVDEKMIELDTLTDPYKNHIFLYDGFREKILYLSSDLDNSLQTYNWNSGKIINKKKIPKEGPEGVGEINSFFVENKDSIYLLSSYSYKLSLVNSNYKVSKRYSLIPSLETANTLGKGMFPIGKQACPIGMFEDKIILGGYPFLERFDKKFYTEGKTSLLLDKHSGSIEYLTSVPPSYLKRFKDGFKIVSQNVFLSQTFNYKKGLMVISHRTEPFIEVIDLKSRSLKREYAGSDKAQHIPWIKKKVGNQDDFDFFVKNAYFSSIYYDKFRNVYYRLLESPNPDKKDSFDGKSWTIPFVIILDENFKKIGETPLPPKFAMASMIITEKGTYINQYDEREGKLVFTLFKLVKK
jgi:hypothetical protein